MNFSLQEGEKKFLIVFLGSFTALYLIVQILPIAPLLEGLASLEAKMLNFAGANASSAQTIIFTPSMEFEIIRDCSGLVMIALLAALLLASNANVPKLKPDPGNSLKTLLFFAPLLLAFNVLRLLATLFVGAQLGRGVLEAVHFSLWIVDSVVVLLIWAKSQQMIFRKETAIA